jgi:hypothetical protein
MPSLASKNSIAGLGMPLLFTVTNVGVFLPLLLAPLIALALIVDDTLLRSGDNMALAKFD